MENQNIVNDVSIFIRGYEWGPGVPKVLLHFQKEISHISFRKLAVKTAGAKRKIKALYLCDENGTAVSAPSAYAAVEMETTYRVSGSPFVYDSSIFMNKWAKSYPVSITGEITVDNDASVLLNIRQDCIDHKHCPDTERFNHRDSFTGIYRNSFTEKDESITLRTAAYEPSALADGAKKPLIIWLHGQGEGGTDVDIELLGNEVCALAREKIQSHFFTGDQKGAYVLAVQCETYWMDEGDGTNGQGSGISRYTQALMDTISHYVSTNPHVDPNRIYLGGCSNGGYMTINMLIQYPGYFAAAYPNCEAYSFYEYVKNKRGVYTGGITKQRWITEDKLERLKQTPIWFIVSANDNVVAPSIYTLPTYQALIEAGADNCRLSLFASVEGTDSPGTSYPGHFVWIYTFQDKVTGIQDAAAYHPTNHGGGLTTPQHHPNLFAWLNAQTLSSVSP